MDEIDSKALEAAHEAYCTYGQTGHLRAQRMPDHVLRATIEAYLAATPPAPQPLAKLVGLVEELCDAVDAEAIDVGGTRGSLTILREIGPLVADAKAVVSTNAPQPLEGAVPIAWRVRPMPGFSWVYIEGDPDRNPGLNDYEKQPVYLSPAPQPVGEVRKPEWPALVQLGRTLGFFASAIKSGEPWSGVCQSEYDKANAAIKEVWDQLSASPSPAAQEDGR